MSENPERLNHQSNKAHEGGSPIPHPSGHIHPPDYQNDMNPEPLSGGNFGPEGPHPEKSARTADEIKELHNAYPQFTNDELRQLHVLPEGSRLEQGAVYFDLRNPGQGEIKATGDMTAVECSWLVPKSEADYQLWNRLIGVRNPERLGEADDGSSKDGGI